MSDVRRWLGEGQQLRACSFYPAPCIYALPHDSWLGGHTPQPWLTPCQAAMKKAEEEEKELKNDGVFCEAVTPTPFLNFDTHFQFTKFI